MKNLELYVHIPFCLKKCEYCDFLSFSCDEKSQLAYADALIREIEFYGPQMKDYFVTTILPPHPNWAVADPQQALIRSTPWKFHYSTPPFY